MTRKRWLFNSLLALVLTFSLLAGATGTALAGKNDPPKADPRLLQMAEENPDAIFRVIVQKDAKNKDLKDMELEKSVKKGGGKVTKQLDLIVSFSAEMTGKELTKLAKNPKVRWISADAPMVSTAAPGMETYRDEFESESYNNSDGTKSWAGTPWVEFGDYGGPGSGDIEIQSDWACDSGDCLELEGGDDDGWGIYRPANLDGAVSAAFTFEYSRVSRGDRRDKLYVQVSSDGGATWATLETLAMNVTDDEAQSAQYDLSPYASADTVIRFICNDDAHIHFDNVEIAFAYPSAFVSAVRADQVGLTGDGVTVAVIDSGLNYHDDFMTNWNWRINEVMSFTDGGSEDLYGHGTHVSGIIAGSGYKSQGEYRGIATEAGLISLKVADKDGMMYESDVIEAMEWVYNNKDAYNIRVVNVSLNSTVAQSYHTSPLSAAVEVLWFNSIVVVISAGNNGTGDGPVTLYPPANDPFVITVGATEDKGTTGLGDDTLAVFSAYGTTEDGFVKPDLLAPGRNLIAPLAEKASTVYTEHPLHRVDDYYFRMSGTSMSAPVVTGAVALLLEDEPSLNPDQVKQRLLSTANYNWSSATSDSTGYLDVYAAVNGTTTDHANQGIMPSLMLASGEDGIDFASVGWNTVGWNTVGWNTVGWNTVGWNTVGWNTVGWNTTTWDD